MNPLARLTKDARRARTALRRAVQEPQARRDLPRKLRIETRTVVESVRPGRRDRVKVEPVRLPEGPVAHPEITAAVILDRFSEVAFRYEWAQVAVTPQGWREELAERRPDLLFVESAWRGNDEAWRLAMTGSGAPSTELRELVAWCREQGIPTVFWNKEDPPNYDRFIDTARLFDQVFTVDAGRIPDYRRDLGHDRVGLLPFGAQPRVHSPVQRSPRREGQVVFAGSYFAEKHPERRAQMEALLDPARAMGLHIYDRMRSPDPRYQYPRRFRSHIMGSLSYEQALAAATQYRLFLNVNSVTGSPTMCARRLFELSAARTPVLSGPAASIEPFFGDTITVAATPEEGETALKALLGSAELRDRLALRAWRTVMEQHTYGHRVAEVLRSVGLDARPVDRSVSAIVPTMRPGQVDHVLRTIAAQRHEDVELVLVTHGFELPEGELQARAREGGVERLVLLAADASVSLGEMMNRGVDAASGRYVAKMDDDNLYTEHYLWDLVRAFDQTQAQVVGKWAHYVHLGSSNATLLRFRASEHRYTSLVQGGTILTPREVARSLRFEDLPRRVDTTFLDKVRRDGGLVYSSDRFSFVSMRAATPDGHTWGITDQQLLARSSELVFYGDPEAHVTV